MELRVERLGRARGGLFLFRLAGVVVLVLVLIGCGLLRGARDRLLGLRGSRCGGPGFRLLLLFYFAALTVFGRFLFLVLRLFPGLFLRERLLARLRLGGIR